MRELPVGRQSFKEIQEEDLLYVDKTRQVYDIIKKGKLYFLSRPRRFGKSLLISTFRHLFEGRKALFQNLYIGQSTDYEFETYPVLQFNFANYGFKERKLEELLVSDIKRYAEQFDVEINNISLSYQLSSLVENISKKYRPVVFLVDEYDKPVVDFLTDYPQAKANQEILRRFFSPLKGLDSKEHIHFLFITGVSKFSKISLFSDLNNLTDLSVSLLSKDLLGITHDELLFYFKERIEAACAHHESDQKTILAEIKRWYNGYSYDGKTFLYNPFSLLSFFLTYEFDNYWFATGTPTFLVNTIRDRGIHPQEFEEEIVDNLFFQKFSLERLDMTGLLFQTGYLTIKKTEKVGFERHYFLGYPNAEVRKSMMFNLVESFTFHIPSTTSHSLIKMQRALKTGNVSDFIAQLKIIFSQLKYNWQPPKQYKTETEILQMWEGYFHAIVYLIMSYMELYVDAEVAHHKGRLDLVAQTSKYLYLMEFKMESTAKEALAQIKTRDYLAPYQNTDKQIFLVGIQFSNEERNIVDWEVEEFVM
ncbi:MAG: AAA family ATPase [Bacteroidota bacterium]